MLLLYLDQSQCLLTKSISQSIISKKSTKIQPGFPIKSGPITETYFKLLAPSQGTFNMLLVYFYQKRNKSAIGSQNKLQTNFKSRNLENLRKLPTVPRVTLSSVRFTTAAHTVTAVFVPSFSIRLCSSCMLQSPGKRQLSV